MSDEHAAMVKHAELLSVWTGTIDGSPHILLSLRVDEATFAVTNIALSASQARRLLDDLSSRFENSAILKGTEPLDPELRLGFDRLVSESEHC